MVDINVDKNKLVITLPSIIGTRRRSTRIEKGLAIEDLKAQRPVRNIIDTELDDIISEIKDLETASLAKYEKIMEAIEEARLINNIFKTIEELRNDNMIEIYHELLSD
jgi:hypothetical protein